MSMIHVLALNINIFMKLKKQLNKEPFNTCDWFVYNKLSIYFGEDKTKSVHFAIKF